MSTSATARFPIRLRTWALSAGAAIAPMAGALTGGAQISQAAGSLPCDLYAAGGTPCVAAHSTRRAPSSSYSGPLYQVRRASDGTTRDIGLLSSGGFADAVAQDSFCAGTTCLITVIYDQSGRGNHHTQDPPGGSSGPAAGGYDNLATGDTKVQTWPCNGQHHQQWNVDSNGTITGVPSGLCLDVTGASTANGAPVELRPCNGGSNPTVQHELEPAPADQKPTFGSGEKGSRHRTGTRWPAGCPSGSAGQVLSTHRHDVPPVSNDRHARRMTFPC